MTRRLAPRPPSAPPAVPRENEADGDPVKVVVAPEDVWPAPQAPAPPGPEPAHETFYAPLVLVTLVSAALLALTIAGLGVLLWLRR